jgi:inner membrane protein
VRLFGWLGMAADLDFLVGRHSRETHSVGATLVVGLGVWLATRRPRLAVAGTLAYASHILLDWLGNDTVAPIGIMALWPFTSDFYQSSLFVFEAVSRRIGAWSSWVHNARAVAREIAILGPLLVVGLARWPGWKKLRLRPGA